VPHEGSVTLDLGGACSVAALVLSGDRTAMSADRPCNGYTVEGSSDGQTWQMARDSRTTPAPPAGHAVRLTPAAARHVRLTMWGLHNRSALLDELTLFGTRDVRPPGGAPP
jgi:hypothetical protein